MAIDDAGVPVGDESTEITPALAEAVLGSSIRTGVGPDARVLSGDTAINQVAVTSVAYREARLLLSRTLRWSLGYGIPLAELVATSGLPESLVLELLDEVD